MAYQHISWPVLNFRHISSRTGPVPIRLGTLFPDYIQIQIKAMIFIVFFQQYNVIPFPLWQCYVHYFFRCDGIQMWPYSHDVCVCVCASQFYTSNQRQRKNKFLNTLSVCFSFEKWSYVEKESNLLKETRIPFNSSLNAIIPFFFSRFLFLIHILSVCFFAIDNENQDQIKGEQVAYMRSPNGTHTHTKT